MSIPVRFGCRVRASLSLEELGERVSHPRQG